MLERPLSHYWTSPLSPVIIINIRKCFNYICTFISKLFEIVFHYFKLCDFPLLEIILIKCSTFNLHCIVLLDVLLKLTWKLSEVIFRGSSRRGKELCCDVAPLPPPPQQKKYINKTTNNNKTNLCAFNGLYKRSPCPMVKKYFLSCTVPDHINSIDVFHIYMPMVMRGLINPHSTKSLVNHMDQPQIYKRMAVKALHWPCTFKF